MPETFTIQTMTALQLQRMSRADKVRAMETLWSDLTRDDRDFGSPAWHGQALREAESKFAAGQAKFLNWEDAKKNSVNGENEDSSAFHRRPRLGAGERFL